ncbi:CRISPR-associated protein Cas5 [Effusibacillus lacus]|uniref:CRISPR-associated protein Cas5 n=1 Tax=Effusibacillus lacus TaxID=1348429 RepID=A0A292YI38_9BACL|nr:CRISPR-associated protein Cas5 [Effusibacillus lacus]TCS68780.1 CRISPR-associated Cas5h family protein [Effusibacillus lacus]GAX90697.1 CRISPR-associated protein Cas5 [Effusibacillus lacus]
MQTLIFELRGSIAHFRRPDTTAAHLTYPFITRTALRGLLGSILGLDEFHGEAWTGVELVEPVRTRSQELSLLGKGFVDNEGSSTFNRPTSVELVVQPHYRIYYQGEHLNELAERIRRRQSVYHTYLGSAFALTVPEYVDLVLAESIVGTGSIQCLTVVPEKAIAALHPVPGVQYARVNAMLHQHIGQRRFRGSMDIIYEVNGRPITLDVHEADHILYRFVRVPQGVVCLW